LIIFNYQNWGGKARWNRGVPPSLKLWGIKNLVLVIQIYFEFLERDFFINNQFKSILILCYLPLLAKERVGVRFSMGIRQIKTKYYD